MISLLWGKSPISFGMGKSDISVTVEEEVVRVDFITVVTFGSSEYCHTPPILSLASRHTAVRPLSSMDLHAAIPDHPAPMTVTSWYELSSDAILSQFCWW